MPRRNLFWLIAVTVISLACYQRVQHDPYGRVLANAISRIEQRYIEPVKPAELFQGAMEGMLGDLDEYSAYVRPAKLQEFHETIDQQFGGVGLEVGIDPKTKQLTVLCPLVGAPAYLAGVRAGDAILRIDAAATQGMSLNDAVGLLRGKPGSVVTLALLHEGNDKIEEVKIVRAVIKMDTVLGDSRNADGSWNYFLEGADHIGYLRITSFGENTVEELGRAMNWLVEHEMRGLVLDLRDNPGGLLSSAVDACDMFIDDGVIVTIRRRDGRISETYRAGGDAPFTDFPMAVLVNQYSASAAEIMAACLQDHHRAVVVGQRSYGKGTVQEVLDLEDDCGAMKLTTASYWRPSGKNIHRLRSAAEKDEWGVQPNESGKLPIDADEFAKWQTWRRQRDLLHPNGSQKPPEPFVDRQLVRAEEIVEKEVK